jgi:hypothetical protein
MTYSNVYSNINAEVVNATKKLVKSGYMKRDNPPEIKLAVAEIWLMEVCNIYGIKTIPTLEFNPSEGGYHSTGGGTYRPANAHITLYKKFSLVTLLHEFRHHMQSTKQGMTLHRNDHEEDARAWSVSLFKLATPKMFANAVEKGLLHFH